MYRFLPCSAKKQNSIFQAARPYFGGREQEILENLNQCNDNQKVCMKYLYGTMPISDIANYDFSLFLNMLIMHSFRENTPWC